MPERRDIFVLEVCACEFQNMRNDQVYFETLLPVTDFQPQREREKTFCQFSSHSVTAQILLKPTCSRRITTAYLWPSTELVRNLVRVGGAKCEWMNEWMEHQAQPINGERLIREMCTMCTCVLYAKRLNYTTVINKYIRNAFWIA